MSKGTINHVMVVGNLGRDPEIRVSQSGTSIGSLSVATVESRKGQNGWEDHTEWHRVTVFGKGAEFLRDYAKKGTKISVMGRLQTRKWQDKEGKDQYTTEIVANEVQIMDRPNNGDRQERQASDNQTYQKTSHPQDEKGAEFDDDIPF